MKIWNVAVVGAGIGRNHITEGYNVLPDKFRVLALCDIDPKRLQAVSEQFSIPRATASFGALLAMPDLDIIDICTPPALHLEQSLAALAAGKQVICEKPLVGSLADADRLIATEQSATGRLLPVFQYRFGNGLQKAKHIIASGIAGRPYLATVETAWTRRAAYYAVPWRGKYQTELGGTLVAHAIHAHDLLTYLMGPIASVFARADTRVNAVEVEDTAVASLVMQSGALASLSVTLGSAREISRLRLYFEHVTFESSRSPYAPGEDPWQILPASAQAANAIDQALSDWGFVRSRYAGLFAAYHTALETCGPLPITLAEARASLELITPCTIPPRQARTWTFRSQTTTRNTNAGGPINSVCTCCWATSGTIQRHPAHFVQELGEHSLRKRALHPEVELHPAAAGARGVANGDWVSIETPEGRVRARARLNDSLDPHVVVGEHGWWQACAEIGAPGYDPFGPDGANLNLIIGPAALDPVSGTASHRSYLCEIRPTA